MRTKKNTVSVSEINEVLHQFLVEVEGSSRRYNRDEQINYPYATGMLTSTLKLLVTLATTGATPTEVRDALVYETMLASKQNR